MKMKTLSLLLFILFFAAGFGVVLMTPPEVQAEQPCENDPNDCNSSITCLFDATCPPGTAANWRVWKDPADIDCTGPFSCFEVKLGCACTPM